MRSDNGKDCRRAPCILCGMQAVEQFLDLGKTALANKFLAENELSGTEPMHPLRIGFCHECGHVQLTERVPPSEMFEDYLYVSSASDTLKTHLYALSDVIVERCRLKSDDLVVDIGCNDETLLKGFRRHGVKTLGVDPARNLAELNQANEIDRYVGFFNSQTAKDIVDKWGTASVITATNTFPHIPELQDFVQGIRTALAPGGTFVIEAHYLVDLLDYGAFDTIYHEHVSYWALGPMMKLFENHGMQIVDAERLALHHGQLRVFVQREGEGRVQSNVRNILEEERQKEVDRFETYQRFAQKTYEIRRDLHRAIKALRSQGKRIVGYGAPAKANTLLSFLELGPETLEYIVDRSPLKQGRYTPGQHIPIVPPERMLADLPDFTILLAWNFADEILEQQRKYIEQGGKFILPLPDVKIL